MRQLLATFLAHEEKIRNNNTSFSRDRIEWMAELATFGQYWTDDEELILRHCASNSSSEANLPASEHTAAQTHNTESAASASADHAANQVRSEASTPTPQFADPSIQADVFISSLGDVSDRANKPASSDLTMKMLIQSSLG
ncbi:hypothetical protein VTL71DRAFT_15756 [Oculimacula yallundae]|uniref:Uncharacterized protein n=1 Tax=Oculimacula yallundae TaxID=86028 RepID=A0ABR4CD34_9HELO